MSLVARLVSIIESDDAELDQRIAAAHELAQLGDPRCSGVEQVAVPAGIFLRGEPAEPMVVGAFSIDRFPVTVGAFAGFVDARGYRERRYWSEDGWAWREAGDHEKPRFWGEEEWRAYLVPNHPVVGVSFYEAEAFASFRGARLPTEVEWEKAARGTDGRKYPWGPDFIEGACGMRGVGPRSTVPVGVFPRGESPYGARDMVGCVWQWCADPFRGWRAGGAAEAEADDEPGDDARRTTAGGAWNTLAWSVTCLGRNGFPKGARFSNLGFRCVAPGGGRAR